METQIKCDKNDVWGFKEEYNTYTYKDNGYCEIIVGFDGVDYVEPNLLIGDKFISMSSKIDEKIGKSKKKKDRDEEDNLTVRKKEIINSYVRAKDPFYSRVGDCFLLKLRIKMDMKNLHETTNRFPYFPNETTYELYKPHYYKEMIDEETQGKTYYLFWSRIEDIPYELKQAIRRVSDQLAYQRMDKVSYLYYRTWRAVINASKQD